MQPARISSVLKENSCSSPLVLVIDALDECDGDKDVQGDLATGVSLQALEGHLDLFYAVVSSAPRNKADLHGC